jgi:NAD(P)H-flavin reductase
MDEKELNGQKLKKLPGSLKPGLKWEIEINPNNTHVFLCGNPRMTGDMTELLESEGYTEWSKKNPEGQIHVEKFF